MARDLQFVVKEWETEMNLLWHDQVHGLNQLGCDVVTFLESWAIWEKTQRDEDLETAKVKGEALVPKFDSIITELRMS